MNESVITKEISAIFNFLPVTLHSVVVQNDDELDTYIIEITCNEPEDEYFERDAATVIKFILERKHTVSDDFIIDINGSQIKTIEATKQKARIAAERVRAFGKPYEFSPMSSYERMIIHSVLKQEPGVTTASSGVGRERRLSVHPEK